MALESAGRTGEALFYYRKFLAGADAGLNEYREQAPGRIEALSLNER